ncbi:MAG TPA: hypothetical protein ENN17_11735 [bacterium]|nr:hypothetical protein [bacterium]
MNVLRQLFHHAEGSIRRGLFPAHGFNRKRKRKKSISPKDDALLAEAYCSLIPLYLKEFEANNVSEAFLAEYFELNPILFEGCSPGRGGEVDLEPVILNVERLPETGRIEAINMVFSDLLSRLHELHSVSVSPERSEEALVQGFTQIRNRYTDSPLAFDILRHLPKGILEEERIALLPRDELEMRVRERTRKLTELNLALQKEIEERMEAERTLERQAEELARTNAELEQFFFIASHQLQEPIRNIVSYSQLLKRRHEDYFNEEADTFMTFIVEGGLRIQDLVNDVRVISQVNTHGRPFEPVDCTKLVETVDVQIRNKYKERKPSLSYESLPTVMGDRKQLYRVFIHLVDNAVKFCDAPIPRIYIRAETGEQDYRFLIRDNGIGIDPEYFERIFLIFKRLHTDRDYPGTGAGLALCKKIVGRHGGKIWVESGGEGKGSTFCFTLRKTEDGG